LRLGFVAGWDYHGSYPGTPTAYTGLVGVTGWTTELSLTMTKSFLTTGDGYKENVAIWALATVIRGIISLSPGCIKTRLVYILVGTSIMVLTHQVVRIVRIPIENTSGLFLVFLDEYQYESEVLLNEGKLQTTSFLTIGLELNPHLVHQ
jgi:hypothetical protein